MELINHQIVESRSRLCVYNIYLGFQRRNASTKNTSRKHCFSVLIGEVYRAFGMSKVGNIYSVYSPQCSFPGSIMILSIKIQNCRVEKTHFTI